LVCFGRGDYSWRLLAAAVLIMLGALISVADKLGRRNNFRN